MAVAGDSGPPAYPLGTSLDLKNFLDCCF